MSHPAFQTQCHIPPFKFNNAYLPSSKVHWHIPPSKFIILSRLPHSASFASRLPRFKHHHIPSFSIYHQLASSISCRPPRGQISCSVSPVAWRLSGMRWHTGLPRSLLAGEEQRGPPTVWIRRDRSAGPTGAGRSRPSPRLRSPAATPAAGQQQSRGEQRRVFSHRYHKWLREATEGSAEGMGRIVFVQVLGEA